MADPIGGVSAPNAAKFAVEVTRKQHDQQSQEGKEAVQLIQSATSPQLESSGDVGTKLNFLA